MFTVSLPDITQKTEELCCLPLRSVSGSKKTGFPVSEVAVSWLCD